MHASVQSFVNDQISNRFLREETKKHANNIVRVGTKNKANENVRLRNSRGPSALAFSKSGSTFAPLLDSL